MSEKTMIPVLDFPGNDFITDEPEMIDYLINYIIRNPKESTEFDPDLQANMGEIYAKHCNNPPAMRTAVEDLIDRAIRQELGLDNYHTTVTVNKDAQGRAGITVEITDGQNKHLSFEKWFKSNTEV